jgi:AraC-like DNA-binding protein
VKNLQFPSLAFGARNVHIDSSGEATQVRFNAMSDGASLVCEPLGKSGDFMGHAASIVINGLSIGAVATGPMRVVAKNLSKPLLVIPLAGSGSYLSRGETINYNANQSAALLPSGGYQGDSTLRSSMLIVVDQDRLETSIRSMLGLENQGSSLIELDRPQEIALKSGGIAFDDVFRQYAGAVDLLSTQPRLLDLSGIDEGIYRSIAMMLKPKLFEIEAGTESTQTYSRKLLDRVCQYIQENKHQLITLTDLEQVSCMSRRNLHYAFQHNFSCTPMQWVRVQRLDAARTLLRKVGSNLSVTATAFLCGFNKSSTFSHYYNLRFGELPSVTIANNC